MDFSPCHSVLAGKTVLLGVTGSIAAYKAADIASSLQKLGVTTHAVLTAAAQEFITPLTLQTLTRNRVITQQFDIGVEMNVEHVALAKAADLLLIAPATANVIAKLAHGLCDDFLSTTALATRAQLVVCPAMNTNMLEHPATQQNLSILRGRGAVVVASQTGMLACGDVGDGKLAPVQLIVDRVAALLLGGTSLAGKTVVVSAGPTLEDFDPFRFLSNNSSGKMGRDIARACEMLGARVHLVAAESYPGFGGVWTKTRSAADMHAALMADFPVADFVFMAAAVSDFSPVRSDRKLKKTEEAAEMRRTRDILAEMGAAKTHQVLCGFAAETENLRAYGEDKLRRKNLDFIAVNQIGGAVGFQSSSNEIMLLDRLGGEHHSGVMDKLDIARWLVQIVTAAK
ncbi:Bifunctional phosphopantothenoylcysteine decarboxylase-phosphopantothenate synthase [Spironucleus salmonicida]|uniref:Bifunctional phosphopantothenoylcysteine decarboxylase-phosphopantothenate synthase n=2 Tax=Spironucleus TaxID=39709 RepID=V6LXQ4_9EUKA|nr:Bifunctional phosphopantothenoylcysteine decarboxylase-phosphopantothenate synthase [Spironucleus salmonicida]KAH0575078.1 Bifunctional phosphopantothenoylcysteine decarboxylase-phosphopantothenate synthase [Spironucleus salmonicida]|eukprot:EST48483.1 Bifunctional phosphopantothenoylcysteine decarboxylase - phosphopantothenate synthase [Spironucleus salmonicida]